MSRKIWSNGQLIDFEDLFSRDVDYKNKVWKYNKQGDVEEATTIADDDIVFSGSKSNLRRIADLERNVSILSTKVLTAGSTANYDSDDDNFGSIFDQDVRFKGTVRVDTAPTSNTDVANKLYVDTAVGNLIDSSPDALNTLNELAAALGDDANFASTVTTALATKVDSSSLATVATSGSYNDLTNTPTIPSSFATVATSGDYNDLVNLPSQTNALEDENIWMMEDIPLDANIDGALWFKPSTRVWKEGIKVTRNATSADAVFSGQYGGWSGDQVGSFRGFSVTFNTPLSVNSIINTSGYNNGWISQVYFSDGTTGGGTSPNANQWYPDVGETRLVSSISFHASSNYQYYRISVNGAMEWTEILPSETAITNLIETNSAVDITTTAPTDGQSLVWDNTTSKFVPGDLATETYVDTAIAASSGNALEYTSTPASSTNDAVMLNSDGTVSPVEPTVYTHAQLGRGDIDAVDQGWTSSGLQRYVTAAFVPGNNDLVVAKVTSKTGHFIATIQNNSGSISVGNKLTPSGEWEWLFVDPYDTSKVCYFYQGSNSTIEFKTGTLTGTNIVWDSAVDTQIASTLGRYYYSYKQSTAGNHIIYYSERNLIRKLIWDGTTLTVDSEVSLNTEVSDYIMGVAFSAFNPNIIGYFAGNSGGVVNLVVAKVDWAAGTLVETYNSAVDANSRMDWASSNGIAFNPLSGNLAVYWNYNFDSKASYLKTYSVDSNGIVGSGSQITVTAGGQGQGALINKMDFMPDTNYLLISGRWYTSTTLQPEVKIYSMEGTTLTFDSNRVMGTTYPYSWGGNEPIAFVPQTTLNKGRYFSIQSRPSSYDWDTMEAFFGRTPYVESNIDKDRLLGFAKSDGTTIEVSTQGSIHDGFSGLTPGSTYYVLEDGSIGSSPDSVNAKAGKAVSSTAIIVDLNNVATVATSGSYNDLTDTPTIPSTTGLATEAYVDTAITNLVNGADAAFDTLKEIADAMATDTELSTAISNLVIPTDLSDLTDTTSVIPTDLSDLTDTTGLLSSGSASVEISDTAPSSPSAGDMWFDSTTAKMYMYYDSSWIGISGSAVEQDLGMYQRAEFTATANQTTFLVNYSTNFPIDVYVNGLRYIAEDFTATNGTSVVLAQGVPVDSEVLIQYALPTAGSSSGGVTTYATLAELPLLGNNAGAMAFVSENSKLYIWNGAGWFVIEMVNTAPSITAAPDASYELATDGTPTVITLSATDPEGMSITWTYAVTSGSLGSTATVSQVGNVFTITPSTVEANAGTFGLTFTASDGVNDVSSSEATFNLSFITPFQGSNYGYSCGGYGGGANTNVIDKFPFATDANATDVGDLTVASYYIRGGQSSAENGYSCGGLPSGFSSSIEKFSFSSDGNASNAGSLLDGRGGTAGQSSIANGYGYVSGGNPTTSSFGDGLIQKFSFATDSNATTVGVLTLTRQLLSGQSSAENGYSSGGYGASLVESNIIDKFSFTSDGNATDVGDLTSNNRTLTGQSSSDYGYASGGRLNSSTILNVIQKFPFASDSNAIDVGDLTAGLENSAGQSSTNYGYCTGGEGIYGSVIEKFSFATDANATDVGDLTVARYTSSGQQY